MTDAAAITAVRRLLAQGVSQREIVRRLGVSKGFVWRVVRGKAPHVVNAGTRVERPHPILLDPTDAVRLSERLSAVEDEIVEMRLAVSRLLGPTEPAPN
jgi:transcriptional regulator with XRE-family HTH domain